MKNTLYLLACLQCFALGMMITALAFKYLDQPEPQMSNPHCSMEVVHRWQTLEGIREENMCMEPGGPQ